MDSVKSQHCADARVAELIAHSSIRILPHIFMGRKIQLRVLKYWRAFDNSAGLVLLKWPHYFIPFAGSRGVINSRKVEIPPQREKLAS